MRKVTVHILFLSLGSLLLASCVGLPREGLVLDLTSASTPFMLSPVETQGKTMVFTYESGYSSVSWTTTTTAGGVTYSTTTTSERDIQRPLKDQLQITLMQNPEWLAVSRLDFQASRFLGLSMSSYNYILSLDLLTPMGR